MKSHDGDLLREMQLAHVGRLMAGLSHEFKNHLAIIKELSGLIQDLLLMEEPGKPAGRERFEKIIGGIHERIEQAAEMCRFLSGFAHRMDQPLAAFSVPEVVEEEQYLLSRFARQKRIRLAVSHAPEQPPVFNNPALLQFALFCLIWPLLKELYEDGSILIETVPQGDGVQIKITAPGTEKTAAGGHPWAAMLEEAVKILKAERAETIDQDGNGVVAITITSLVDRNC